MRVILRHSAGTFATAFALLLLLSLSGSAAGNEKLQRIGRGQICVTNGALEDGPDSSIRITEPSMRGFVTVPASRTVEVKFRYLGPSAKSKPLGSGELRRQIGLKLRAQDTCNLVYVMWRIEPLETLAVSVKRNRGMSTHEQCRDHGYINFPLKQEARLPALHPGEWHTLRAALEADSLEVWVDGAHAWTGSLGPQALSIDGPVGMRSDNGRFEFFLQAGEAAPGRAAPIPPCHGTSGGPD